MKSFKLRIIEADSVFFEGECESVVIPSIDGQYGILANHINFITAVVPGMISFREPGKENQIAAVSNGIAKVEDNEVLIVVDSAEHPEEIDVRRAQREADAAKEEMLQKKSMVEYKAAEANLARAMNRLKISFRNG